MSHKSSINISRQSNPERCYSWKIKNKIMEFYGSLMDILDYPKRETQIDYYEIHVEGGISERKALVISKYCNFIFLKRYKF